MLCIGFTSFMFLVSRFLPAAFAGIFTNNAEYIELSVWGIRAFTMMIIPLSLQYTFVDSLTALGMTGLSLFLSLFRKTTYFVATCLLPFAFTAASAFYAEPIADGIAALTSTTAFAIVYMKYLNGTGSLMDIGPGRGQAAYTPTLAFSHKKKRNQKGPVPSGRPADYAFVIFMFSAYASSHSLSINSLAATAFSGTVSSSVAWM